MIGSHVLKNPLHTTLVRYRLVSIISIGFIGYMMYIAWIFFESNHTDMNAASAAGFFTYVGALLAAFVKCVTNIQTRHEE